MSFCIPSAKDHNCIDLAIASMNPFVAYISTTLLFVMFLFINIGEARPSNTLTHGNVGTESVYQRLSPGTTQLKPITTLGDPQNTPEHDLRSRMMQSDYSTTRVKLVHYAYLATMLPITQACSFLEEFFARIATKAGEEWATLPRRSSLAIEEGMFRLEFLSAGDTIPWEFIRTTANSLWESAVMGVTQLFEMAYMNDAGTIAVQVTLTVMDGSSGSSNSLTWREGSVDSIASPHQR